MVRLYAHFGPQWRPNGRQMASKWSLATFQKHSWEQTRTQTVQYQIRTVFTILLTHRPPQKTSLFHSLGRPFRIHFQKCSQISSKAPSVRLSFLFCVAFCVPLAPKGWSNGPKMSPKIRLKARPGALGAPEGTQGTPLVLKVLQTTYKYTQTYSKLMNANLLCR